MKALRALSLSIPLAGLLAGCGKDPNGPVAGDLTVSFTSGTGHDGALLLLVAGPVTSIQPGSGYQIVSGAAGAGLTRVVLTGAIAAGDILRLSVPDVAAITSYNVKVEAAADRTTYALADPALYATTIRR